MSEYDEFQTPARRDPTAFRGKSEAVAGATVETQKSLSVDPITTLEVISWSFSLGGEHFTGSICGYLDEDKYDKIEVTHPLSAKEAAKLNKKDSAYGSARYKKGQQTNRFETRAELEQAAIKQYKAAFPHAKVLTVGNFAVGNAQRCLDGPKAFKDATNRIVAAQERCGGYERNPKEMNRLLARYDQLVKTLKASSDPSGNENQPAAQDSPK